MKDVQKNCFPIAYLLITLIKVKRKGDNKLVITVAPQKLICPKGKT